MSGQILSDPRGSHLDVRRPGFVARAPVRFGWMSGQNLSDPLGSHLGEPHRTVGDATTSMAEPPAEIQALPETTPAVADGQPRSMTKSSPNNTPYVPRAASARRDARHGAMRLLAMAIFISFCK